MTEGPVVPVPVHRVALTSINVPGDEGGLSLYPAMGVWADLADIVESGIDMLPQGGAALPVLLVTDSVLDSVNPAVTNLLVSQARPVTDEDGADEATGLCVDGSRVLFGPGGPAVAYGPCWSIRVPTAWLGLVTSLAASPLQMRMLLIDGAAPTKPEEVVLTLAEVGLAVLPSLNGVSHTLSEVMQPEWTVPLSAPAPVAPVLDVLPMNVMRDLLWTTVSGIALGQEHALNKAVESVAEYVTHLLSSAEEADRAYADAAAEACEWALESSSAYELTRDLDGRYVWGGAMDAIAEHIEKTLSVEAVEAFEDGCTFSEVCGTFGAGAAVPALAVLLAARAVEAMNEPDEQKTGARWTTSYLLGVWFDADTDDPWWATRATGSLLLHHDTDVLADLLAARPQGSHSPDVAVGDDGHSPLTHRMLHVLTEVLQSAAMTPDEFAGLAGSLDLRPAQFADIVHVCQVLLGHIKGWSATDGSECAGCFATDRLIESIADQDRLVRAASAAIPVLADLTAQTRGFQVGDEDWRTFREEFFLHWLGHTAVAPVE